jgi:hypothetical protein
MVTLNDCLEFCDLTEEEVHEIAEHDHIPEIVAAELASALLESPYGVYVVRCYLLENLKRAASLGNLSRARYLDRVITRFNAEHPSGV